MMVPITHARLDERLWRFCDPNAPLPARTMAAKGIAPVKGADLLCVLAVLANDPDPGVREAAQVTVGHMPLNVILGGLSTLTLAQVLHWLAFASPLRNELWLSLVASPHVDEETLVEIGAKANEAVTERIAVNEERLLKMPKVIESLYHNPATRMSTVDRLIDLAVRNNVVLNGIASFQAHADAIKGQLILESDNEPLPDDVAFSHTLLQAEMLSSEASHEDVVERNVEDGSETLKKKLKPLAAAIGELSLAGKIRLAMIGSGAARAILIRDNNRLVSMAAVTSPLTTDGDAATYAHSKEMSADVLRYIGSRRDWLHNYELKRALVLNPKTPQGVAIQFVSHLRDNDLKFLARSRNVPMPIKTAAAQLVKKKEDKDRR